MTIQTEELKVSLLSYSSGNGGAAIAASRLNAALIGKGINSSLLVNLCVPSNGESLSLLRIITNNYCRFRFKFGEILAKLLSHTANPVLHSPALLPSTWLRRINRSNAHIINFHWVQGEMISISAIGRVAKPVVWTLHDMWAFCGAEHYCNHSRWKDGYLPSNRSSGESGFDINRWAWNRKRRHWKVPFHIVCPSSWLASCVRSSALMRTWPVSVIPNPIDTSFWSPISKDDARKKLGLPQKLPLLLFGSQGGTKDSRKGFDLLLSALSLLITSDGFFPFELVVFGGATIGEFKLLGIPVHFLGNVGSEIELRLVYNSCDLLALPSRQDNLPNIGTEAHACGLPIVAFDAGGLPDLVAHMETGYLAQSFDSADFARGIHLLLSDDFRRRAMAVNARARAEALWSSDVVASQYQQLYMRVLAQ